MAQYALELSRWDLRSSANHPIAGDRRLRLSMLQLKHGGEVKVIIIHCSFNSVNLEGNKIMVLES